MQLFQTKVYGGWLQDQNALFASSSGGAFTALSDVFLQQGDVIVCSTYNYKTHDQEYRIITTVPERNNARGSKYVQAVPGDIFTEAETWLRSNPGHNLLFFGMGCQASGFRAFAEVRGFLDRVTIVDIICHGSPSPKVWHEYVNLLEEKHGKISSLSFKDKRIGWMSPIAVAQMQDQEVSLRAYQKVFYSSNELRPSCHKCPYARIERTSDITIGDFWNIKERIPDHYNEKGVSLFIVHTVKGEKLFDHAKKLLNWFESNVTDCLQYNLEKPTPAAATRETFWQEYYTYGIGYIVKKYGTDSYIERIKRKVKNTIAPKKQIY